MPLSGFGIGGVGDRVVVGEGASQWQAESGQYLLAFEGDPASGSLNVIAPQSAPATGPRAEDFFEKGLALEDEDRPAAIGAYRQAVAAGPALVDGRLTLGSALPDDRHLRGAE